MTSWRFGLPPSLGHEPIRALARSLADLLFDFGFSTIVPLATYERLEQALRDGEVDAAWGPPLVCAHLEAAGGRVAARAIRWGASTYRSVLLCRADDRLDLRDLGKTRRRPRAVWVDQESMAGYLLPRAFLRETGVDPGKAFLTERLLGSYETCVREVLDGSADLTATFCSSANATRRAAGYVLLGYRAVELREMAYTAECPNDGIVLCPRLTPEAIAGVREALGRLSAHPETRRLLGQAFDVDGFDEPAPGTYRSLLEVETAGRG